MNKKVPLATAGLAASAVVLVLVAAVARTDAGVSHPVVVMSELLLAGGAAYLLDDAAVAVTTVTPVRLWSRRLPRVVAGVATIAVAAAMVLAVLRWQQSLPAPLLLSGELAVLCLVALAGAALLAAHGESEPGGVVAPVLGLVGLGALIADLIVKAPLFVPWDGTGGAGVRLGWALAGALALCAITLASRDPAASARFRGRPSGRPTPVAHASKRRESSSGGSDPRPADADRLGSR